MRRSIIVMTAVLLLAAGCAAPDEPVAATTSTIAVTTTTTTITTTTEPPTSTSTTETTTASSGSESADDSGDAHDGDDASASDAQAADSSTGRIVDIVMTDFAFEPAEVDLQPGETVTFRVSNEGAIEHELRLSNEHRIAEHLASGHADHDDEGHHEGGDVFVTVPPGESADLTVTVPEDLTFFTQMTCLIPGHYEAGMTGTLHYES
ncbi:MAG: plastocyanin/azurin family copper-binding protein [Halobacteriales archaeon]|nr:plastocyanin/azurin family copper-binding protein [Halobacteriales archaeon]